MNTTRGILHAHAHDTAQAALAPTRTHRPHTRTSRAPGEEPAQPSPFDRAMKAAEQQAEKWQPRAVEGPSSAGRDRPLASKGDASEAPLVAPEADANSAAQPAATPQGDGVNQSMNEADSLSDSSPALTVDGGGEVGEPQGVTAEPPVAISGNVASLLSAPLTVHNLNELLATIDPRLAQNAPVRIAADAPVQGEHGQAHAGSRRHTPDSAAALEHERADVRAAGFAQSALTDADHLSQEPPPRTDVLTEHGPGGQPGNARAPQPGASVTSTPSQPAQNPTTAAAPDPVVTARPPPDPATLNASKSEVHARTMPGADSAKATPVSATQAAPATFALHALTGGQADLGGGGGDHALQSRHAAMLRQASADATDQTFTGQVSRGLAAALKQGADGTVTIRLHPASLGAVRVRVGVDGGKVDVRFSATTPQARTLLASSLGVLRESVERRGLSVESLDVDDGASADPRRTEAAPGTGAGVPSATADEARTQPPDHGWSADTRPDHGQHAPDGHAHGRHDAERREGTGGGAAEDAEVPAAHGARGVVRITQDGVHEHDGGFVLRLDALA